MFSFLAVQKTKRFFFASLVFVLLTGFFTGCGTDSDNGAVDNLLPNGLLGRWVDPGFGDGYEITRDSGEERIIQFFPDMEWEGEVFPGSISGGIVRHVNVFTAAAGFIIFEHTIGDIPDPNRRFGAVAYRNLIAASVEMATAWYPAVDGAPPALALAATLEEAIAKFTVDTVGDYIAFWGGPYLRQNQ